MPRFIFLIIGSIILLSSCLTSSRIGFYQQSETINAIGIKGKATVLVFSAPINEKSTVDDLLKRITKTNNLIDTRTEALKKGLNIPTYITPDKTHEHLSQIANNSNYQYLIIVDGYEMPTEYNGGNLVSTIIEVWDISNEEIIYNSHSTVKSKTKYIKNDSGSLSGAIFNRVVGEPLGAEELLTQGLRREIRKLKKVY